MLSTYTRKTVLFDMFIIALNIYVLAILSNSSL